MSKFPPPSGFVPPPAPMTMGGAPKFVPPPTFQPPHNNNNNNFQQPAIPSTNSKFPAPMASNNGNNNNVPAPQPFVKSSAVPAPAFINNTNMNNNTNKIPAPAPFNTNNNNNKAPFPAPASFTPNNNNNNNNTTINNNIAPSPAGAPAPFKAPSSLPLPAPTPNGQNINNFVPKAPPNIPANNCNNNNFPAPFVPPPAFGKTVVTNTNNNNNNSNNPTVQQGKFPFPAPNNVNSKFPLPPPNNINNTTGGFAPNKGFPAPPMNNNNSTTTTTTTTNNNNNNFPPPPSSNNGIKFPMPNPQGTSQPRPGPFVPPPPPPSNNNNSSGANFQNLQQQQQHQFSGNNSFNQNQQHFDQQQQSQQSQQQQRAPVPIQQQQQQQQQPQPQQQHQQVTSPTSREEVAVSHTMILEKSTVKSTRLMRHNSIPRTSSSSEMAASIRSVVPSTVRNNANSKPYHSRFNVRNGKAVETQAVQCTTNVMPGSPQIADRFGLPVGVSVRPLAPVYRSDYCGPEDEASPNNRNSRLAPPLVHFQEIDQSITMIRCAQCRSYINPFVSFTSPDRYICSVCRRSNAVPIAYQCEVDRQTGLRTDILQRQELLHGCCDIVAPQEYVQGAPKRPTMLFLIDASYQAVTSGFLAKVCEGIKLGLCDKKFLSDDYQVAFIVYDSNVYLFNLSPELEAPKMIAAPDLVFDKLEFNERGEIASTLELPCLLEDVLCSPVESGALIGQLMDKLPHMFASSNSAEVAFGPALNTAMSILAAPGGKVFAFVGSCPGAGEGMLDTTASTKRGAPVNSSETPVNTLPANDFYKTRAIACSAHQISVDLIVSAANEVDLATIAPISRYTSGHISRVHAHMLPALPENIAGCLGREYGFDAVLRIRAPSNVTLKNFYGHLQVKGPDLLALPVCDSDSVYSFELAPTNVVNHTPVFVQVAFMYTTRTRERRIRVITFGMETSSDLAKLYNHCSAPVCASFYSKMLVDQCIGSSFHKSIQHIVDKLGISLQAFRTIVHGMSRTPNQLSLPHSLMGLPLLLAGVFRSAAVRPLSFAGTNPASTSAVMSAELRSNDERVAVGSTLVFSPIDYFVACSVPTVWCVWDPNVAVIANGQMSIALDDLTGEPVLPRSDVCSVESLRSDSIYLIDCAEKLFCWVGKNVAVEVVQSFGLNFSSGNNNYSNNNNNHNGTNLFPEARLCAKACADLIDTRQQFLSREAQAGTKWGSVIMLFQDPSCKLDFEYSDCNVAFAGLPFFTGGTERSLYPYLVDDDMQDAVSYGSLLMNLAKKAGEQ